MEYNSLLLLLPTNLLLREKHRHFVGSFAQFWENFYLYVNGRLILEEIGEMSLGEKERYERFTLMGEKSVVLSFKGLCHEARASCASLDNTPHHTVL